MELEKITLAHTERGDLELLLADENSDPDLIAHYAKSKDLYVTWCEHILTTPLPAQNKDGSRTTIFYDPQTALAVLAQRICTLDARLRKLFKHREISKRVNFSQEEVCQLFAKNVMAKSPVKETDE